VSGREEQNIATITMAGHESHGGHPATSMTQDSSDSPTLLLKIELVETIQTGANAFERFCTLLNRLLSLSRSVARSRGVRIATTPIPDAEYPAFLPNWY
jgi:hypothetical protein